MARRRKRPDPLDIADPGVQQSLRAVWQQEEAVGTIYLINPTGGAVVTIVRPLRTLEWATAPMPSPIQEAPSDATTLSPPRKRQKTSGQLAPPEPTVQPNLSNSTGTIAAPLTVEMASATQTSLQSNKDFVEDNLAFNATNSALSNISLLQSYYGIPFYFSSFSHTPLPDSSSRSANMLNSTSFIEDLDDPSTNSPCSHPIAGDLNSPSSPILSSRRRESSLVAQESPSILNHGVSSTAQDPPIIPSESPASAVSVERSPIAPPVCEPAVVSQCHPVSVGDGPYMNLPSELSIIPQSFSAPKLRPPIISQSQSSIAALRVGPQCDSDVDPRSNSNHSILPEQELSVTCLRESTVDVLHNPLGAPRSEPFTPSQCKPLAPPAREPSVPPEPVPSVPQRTPSAAPRELPTALQHESPQDPLISGQDKPSTLSESESSVVSEGHCSKEIQKLKMIRKSSKPPLLIDTPEISDSEDFPDHPFSLPPATRMPSTYNGIPLCKASSDDESSEPSTRQPSIQTRIQHQDPGSSPDAPIDLTLESPIVLPKVLPRKPRRCVTPVGKDVVVKMEPQEPSRSRLAMDEARSETSSVSDAEHDHPRAPSDSLIGAEAVADAAEAEKVEATEDAEEAEDVEDEDHKPCIDDLFHRVKRSSTEPYYEEVHDRQMPPLIEASPNTRIAGRSRLWGLWTDSVRLQRRLEKLESSAHCCTEEFNAGGWF